MVKPGGAIFVYNLPKWNILLGAYLMERHLTFRHNIAISIKTSLPLPGRLYPTHYSLLYFTKGKPKTFRRIRTPIRASHGKEPEMRRIPDGAWLGKKGAQNTRVSAVLIASSIIPWTVGAHSPVIYHNPWAKFPCSQALAALRSAHPEDNKMKVREGITGYDLFGLPQGWPIPASELAGDQ